MPVRHCIAVNCNSDSRKDAYLRFHQLPKVDNVRKKWLCLVRREGLDINPATDNRHHVVCEKHFVDGFPTPENPFPTLFAYNNFKQRTPRKSKNSIKGRHTDETECTHEPEVKKVKLVKCNKEQKSTLCYPYVSGEIELTTFNTNDVCRIKENSAYECSRGQTEDHSYHCTSSEEKYCHQEKLLAQIVCLEAKCGQLETENRKLEEENKRLKTENEDLKSSTTTLRELFLHNVLQNDKNVKHFLGIGSLALFASLLHLISKFYDKISFWKGAGRSGTKQWQARQQRKPGVKRKLTVKEEFVLVMMKFRLGLDNITLSTLFGVSVGYISNLFSTWMNLLAQLLDPLIKWPTKDKIRKHLPLAFKLKYPNTTSIIDCTEIFIQKPKNCSAQASTWSNYKTHNTLKALVAIQPNGAFTFVSKLWSGNISDRKITIDSKYLDKISPGDEVMADRGFQIRDLLTLKGAYLNMPPFTREKKNGKGRMLSSKQIIETRRIASLRIHVERAIRRLKSFKMLAGILPLNMKNLSSSMLCVAAALCNLMPPLVKKFK